MSWVSECISSGSGASGSLYNCMRLRSSLNAYWKSIWKARAALCALWIVPWMTVPCINSAQAQTPGLATEEKLIKDFTDPLTTLPQISLKDAFTPANFGTHVQTNQVILRPIIPRVRRFSLFPLIQLIRPSFSLVTVPSARGGTRTEFGDIQLFDLAVLPWPSDETHLKIGLGPMFVFPTDRTHDSLLVCAGGNDDCSETRLQLTLVRFTGNNLGRVRGCIWGSVVRHASS